MGAIRFLLGVAGACVPGLVMAISGGLVSTGGVSQGNAYTESSGTYQVIPGQGVQISLPHQFSAFGLNLGTADLSQYTHLLLTVTNNGATPSLVEVVFDSGSTGWASSPFLIGAGTTENVTVPLEPSPLGVGLGFPTGDSTVHQTTFFGSLVKNSVHKIRLWNQTQSGSINLTVGQMTLVSLTTPTASVIDVYGQQNVAFPGRITSDQQLAAQVALDNQLSGQLPYSNDIYGGLAGSGFGAPTGKWSVAKQNGRWYIIDPSGNRFFSTGIDGVGNGDLAITQGRSSLFAAGALPNPGTTLAQFFYYAVNPATGLAEPGFDFYQANLERKYGSGWVAQGDATAVRRLKTWGFNTLGVQSHYTLYSNPSLQMANTQVVGISGAFQIVPCPGASFPMPDVYDPAWATAVTYSLSPVVASLRSDTYNMGLFVDDELPWAQLSSQANYRYDLAFNVLSAPANQPAKQRFYKNLTMKYRTIQKLNTAWGTAYGSWNDLLNNQAYRPASPSAALVTDMQTFLTGFATQYFSTIRAKLAALNYHGLYLGCRFRCYAPEVLAAAARYCDVVSFNAYDITPSQWRSDLKALNAPVMISEFGFAAADQGRVGGFSLCAVSESDRIQAYQNYAADAATWNNLVGLHWYKWEDDPVTGRMWDNSNVCFGFVSITDVPYAGMAAAATQVNTNLNGRMINP
ncbi:MAG: hypothetical protein ACHQ50_01785 [Fimbriimonadales bacterium]